MALRGQESTRETNGWFNGRSEILYHKDDEKKQIIDFTTLYEALTIRRREKDYINR